MAYKGYWIYQLNKKEHTLSFKKFCNDGKENTLMDDCGLLSEYFKPSYLIHSGMAQTLYSGVKRAKTPEYFEELFELPDGGQIKLQSIVHPSESKGVIAVIPGVSGDGHGSYVINTVNKALENGYSAYVINHRGCWDTPLLTPITYHGGSSFDTKAAVKYIKSKHPNQPIYGVSYSLGSNILGNYLGEEGEDSLLSGAVCIGSPFKTYEASTTSENALFGGISWYLAYKAKNILHKHKEMFPQFEKEHQIDIPELIKTIKGFRDFDDKITSKVFGYTGAVDYYTKCSVIPKMKNIKTKTLFISSLDDPFFGPDVIPYEEFKKNENIYLIASPGGGHIGFYDSVLSNEQWHNKPVMKFFDYLNATDRFTVSI